MKKLILTAILATLLVSCGKSIKVTNEIKIDDCESVFAMKNIYISHYVDGNMAGQAFVDSLAQGKTTKSISIPSNVEYVRVSCELVAQDTTLFTRYLAFGFKDKELQFGTFFYTNDKSTKIVIDGRTKYRSVNK